MLLVPKQQNIDTCTKNNRVWIILVNILVKAELGSKLKTVVRYSYFIKVVRYVTSLLF